MMHYRTVSHWLTWEDLDFPNSGIERKILDKARAAHDAGVEMVMIFGFHFRWDFIYCFETVHTLLKFVTDAYHAYGIKVVDHHSAVLTHRPRNWDGRLHTFQRNHHHVPLTPDAEVAAQLHYNGTAINSWRERRVDDGTPIFVDCYQSEIYCPNNPDFRAAYQSYAARLFRETGIDGLMSDDVCRYAHWAACGCEHCRSSFRQLTGRTLPGPADWSFWGNFDNPDFRRWVEFRYTVGRDFLDGVRRAIPAGALLTTCCSGSTDKFNDACAIDMAIWYPALNAMMLEMCGNITGEGPHSMARRVPGVMLQHAIGRMNQMPVLGLGYAYYPDEAFLIWSFDRFFNNDIWISSHKTRLGIDYDEQKKLPDEPEMVAEAFQYEKRHQELFELADITPLGVYYSPASRSFNGDSGEDYATGFHDTVRELYLRNLPFAVMPTVPDAQTVPFLLLSDCDCLSAAERAALEQYRAAGGTLLVCGLFGNRDEHGDPAGAPALAAFGITQKLPRLDREVPDKTRFFDQWGWSVNRDIPVQVEFSGIRPQAGNGFYRTAERFFWTPRRLHDAANRKQVLDETAELLPPPPVRVTAPEMLQYRLYRAAAGGWVVHFMPTGQTTVPHEYLRFQGQGEPVVREVHYVPLQGQIELSGEFAQATLYSPDLTEARALTVCGGRAATSLDGLKRFFSIRLQ